MTQVKAFPIPLPPVGEQRKIIDAYGSVEESIRSTDAYIAKLETIERGLTVELLGRSGGWRAVRLGDLTNGRPKNGYSPREVDYHTGTLMLGLGCLTPSGFIPRQLKNAPHNDPGLRRAELADGDLLMSRSNTRGSVGLVGRFSSVGNRCIYPDLMMRLVPNASVRAGFLEVLLRSPAARKQIEANAVGTSGSMVKINASTVLGLELKIPDLSEQDRIIDNLAVSRAPIRAARDRRDKLHQLRQGLIDDLLAGRVRLNSGEEVSV
jgi:type I restriction enzyme S subunit